MLNFPFDLTNRYRSLFLHAAVTSVQDVVSQLQAISIDCHTGDVGHLEHTPTIFIPAPFRPHKSAPTLYAVFFCGDHDVSDVDATTKISSLSDR
jgi:hypothetical protein